MKLLFVALVLCVVAVQCEYPKDGSWEYRSEYIKERLATKLADLTPEERHKSIEDGIKFLQGEGPKPENLSTLGEEIVSTLSTEQKQQLVAFLNTCHE